MKVLRSLLTTFLFVLSCVALFPAVGFAAGSAPLEIDEISILGVTAFNPSDLEKVIEVSVGDRLDRTKIVQTAKNIQELYHSAGYETVKIETRLIQRSAKPSGPVENVLEITVTEGKPTRIAEILIDYDLAGWKNRLTSAGEKIGLKPGDIYDRERLLNGFRSMQDALTSWDFLSPKVEESEVEQVGPPDTPAAKELAATTARWVRIRVKVLLGDRVDFAFQGNKVFPNSQLSSWIEEQRLLGFSQDYVERIRSRFKDEYRKLGYDKIEIKVFTFEDAVNQRRRVLYVFSEGPRVEIDHIDFDGNAVFSNSVLLDHFYDKASSSISRGYYVAKDVDQSAALLVEWMKSQGYLTAKVVSISRTYRSSGLRVNLVIYIYEGEQTVVDQVQFVGLTVFSPAELTTILGNAANQPLNLYALNEGLETVKARYRDRGYLDVKIANEGTDKLVLYSDENRVATIHLEIVEGIQYRVSRIEIEGLNKTKVDVVRRELEVHEGDVLSEHAWLRSEAKLRRLGIFATASIKAFPDPDRKDGKILKILLEEGSPGTIAGGVGLRNDLGARAFGQIQYANIWGENHTVALNATTNRRFPGLGSQYCPIVNGAVDCFFEFDTSLGYVWPWFALGQTTFRPRYSFQRVMFDDFDADDSTLQTSWERAIVKSWGLTGVFTYSLENITQYNALSTTDDQHLRIGSISPTLILDRRDSPLAPTKGTYTTAQFDYARPEFGSQGTENPNGPVAYWRFQFRHDVFVPLPKSIDLFLSFRTGLEYNWAKPPDGATGATYEIPLIKQFTLGGVGSLRGYDEDSIFVDPSIAVRGSLTYVNYRAQLDFPFAGAMKFGPFVDAANLNLDHYSLSKNDYATVAQLANGQHVYGPLLYGIGAGFHYKSPVGSVNFDIGFNPSPTGSQEAYKVDFSIGNL